MNKKRELVKNTSIIAIGRFGIQIASFLLLPLYTSRLTTEEYGIYDMFVVASILVVPVITLLIGEAMFRFLIDADSENDRKKIINQTVCFNIFSAVIFTLVAYILMSVFNYNLKWYFIFYINTTILSSLATSLARGLSRIKLFSTFSFLSGILTILLNIIFILFFNMGLEGLLMSYIIVNSIVSLILLFKLKIQRYITLKDLDLNISKSMLKYSVPLVPNSISWTIINLSDRFLISLTLGPSYTGVFSIAHKFPSIVDTFYGYFYTAWKESASKALTSSDVLNFYDEIYRILKRILFSITLCLISLLPFAFPLLIHEDFSDAFIYIPFLAIANLLSNISGFYGGLFSAHKKTKVMGNSTIYAAVLNIIICLLLIKSIGLYAAVISTFISNLAVTLYRRIKVKEYTRFSRDNMFWISSIFILSISVFCYYSENLFCYTIGLIVSVLYSLIVNKSLIIDANNFFKNFKLKRRRR